MAQTQSVPSCVGSPPSPRWPQAVSIAERRPPVAGPHSGHGRFTTCQLLVDKLSGGVVENRTVRQRAEEKLTAEKRMADSAGPSRRGASSGGLSSIK